jgi:ParB-like nuclease domain
MPGWVAKDIPTTEVPLNQLEHSHSVPRSGSEYSSPEELAQAIEINGINDGTAVRLPDGRTIVVGGNSRLAAMRLRCEETLPLKVLNWEDLTSDVHQFLRGLLPDVFGDY